MYTVFELTEKFYIKNHFESKKHSCDQSFKQYETFAKVSVHMVRPSEIQFSDGLIVYLASKSNSQTRQSPACGRWGVLGRGFLGRR